MKESSLKGMWITVNRVCNFRCKWCYAEGTKYNIKDDMSFETAKQLIDLASELGIQSITILGGEPTFWKHLFPTIEYIHEKKLMSTLVTNGFLLSNTGFFEKIRESSLDSISISMKAANLEQHKEYTGVDTFNEVIKGVEAANQLEKKSVSVSFVVSTLTAGSLIELSKVLSKLGTRFLSLDMCSVVFDNAQAIRSYALSPSEYVKEIVENIDEMSEILEGHVTAVQGTLECIWPAGILKRLKAEKKVTTGSCQMSRESGIIFTHQAEIIPCNSMYDFPFGQLGVDFDNAESFLKFRHSDEVDSFFKKIKSYPLKQCTSCKQHRDCIGGCPLQWLVFDPQKYVVNL